MCRPARALTLLGLVSVGALGDSTASKVTPVQKVIELMEGMMNTGKKDKHDEQVQFAAYKQFCDDTSVDKTRSISEAKDTIKMLTADINKYTADAARLTKDIAGHDEDIAVWTGDIKAATKVRDLEKADYQATHDDYTESIEALENAISVLKKQAHDRSQAPTPTEAPAEDVLVQISNSIQHLALVPAEAKQALQAFLQENDDPVGAPEAAGYEFQSQGVIEMLEKLFDKFSEERTSLEKNERESKHAFDMLMQDLDAQIEEAKSDRKEKAKTKAQKLESKASAVGDRDDTTATMKADKKYLQDLTATCEKKSSDFESRQALRAQELEAIQKAIEIIQSESVSGAADTHLPSLMQRGSALASLRSERSTQTQARAAMYLKSRAEELGSRALSSLATRVSDDPFVKVKKMIKDLLVRLMEEASEEADHKGWCDTELATNEQTRKEKTEAVEVLHANIDELQASVAKLTEDINELTEAVAKLDKAMAEATELRQEEKAKNEQTIKDSDEAQAAVARALTVLKEFYSKAGEATALVQQHQPESPEIFDSPYKGMQAENGGVVGMLEVIESDFSRLEAETKASEATSQKEYETFMTDSKEDKEAKNTDIENKEAKKQDENQALTRNKEDLAGTQKELDAALEYFDKLKPSCVDAGVSYDDRVARRKEEIESLQEALKILNGEDIA